MNKKTVLIPLASLAAIGVAALLTIGPPASPAPVCIEIETPIVERTERIEPPRRFARPPAPAPAPRPMPAITT